MTIVDGVSETRTNGEARLRRTAHQPTATITDGDAAAAAFTVSGLYAWEPAHGGLDDVPLAARVKRDELRLDVDGREPTTHASGTSFAGVTQHFHWIATLDARGPGRWGGAIWYTDGNLPFPYRTVDIEVAGADPMSRTATVTFAGDGAPLVRVFRWESASFHPVVFEFDATPDAKPVVAIRTHDHPNRPPGLPDETLSLEDVFRRAGFAVTKSGGDGVIPLSGAGANATWSDAEMHDAMQRFWSRFTDAPQWSLWVLWAAMHDEGRTLGGIMFDDIGPNHRQGTAIFTSSFAATPPAGDSAPDAWVRRMLFWTAAHEMGHAFNLAHAWDKSRSTRTGGNPWIPLVDEPESRSFMNYPFNVAGGVSAFYSDFAYRFSDTELLFLRHAPAQFVQMGNAEWFDNHAFEQPAIGGRRSEYRLELRVNRPIPDFEFMEPVVVELKLTNTSTEPKIIRGGLAGAGSIVAVIEPEGKPARQWLPYAHRCVDQTGQVLAPGESMYAPLPLYAGVNGWDLAEPGRYRLQVVIGIAGEQLASNPLVVRVAAPVSRDHETVASDYFTDDVGRTLVFGGTAVLAKATDTLRETVERLPDSRAAIHARAALALPMVKDYKTLTIPYGAPELTSAAEAEAEVTVRKADVDEALGLIGPQAASPEAAESLGNITFRLSTETMADALAGNGDVVDAADLQKSLLAVLSGRGVLPTVLSEVSAKTDQLEAAAAKPKRTARRTATSGTNRRSSTKRSADD